MKETTKKNIIRVIMLLAAIAMILSFVLLPLMADAAENSSVSVTSFESGRLSDALTEAMNGTDRNNITSAAVSGGELSASDFNALCDLPNLEFIELAGAEASGGMIPDNALPSRNRLSYISLPKNTVSVGNGAFSNCKQLKKISMPSSVREIGNNAFDGCIALEDITPPAALEHIGEAAFRDCQSLAGFTLPQGVTSIPAYCFSKCPFTEFYIGPQVETIGEGAFSDCHELKDIYIYGDKAPVLEGGGVFQNLNVTVHTADGAEGYENWNSNFVNSEEGFNEEYAAPEPAVPPENVYEDQDDSQQDTSDTAEDTSASEESSENVTDTSEKENKSGKKTDTDDDDAPAQETTLSSPDNNKEKSSGNNSAVTIIIAAAAAAAVTVIVNLIFIKARKNKN